jgi:G3E family GTPase
LSSPSDRNDARGHTPSRTPVPEAAPPRGGAAPGGGIGRDPLAGRLPVTVVTGFLGSGKTTLIRRLLAHPGMNRAAVIVNEFGEVGIDHDLIAASSENVALLSNGCLCCVVRTDLQETLRTLFAQRRAGEVIDFDRVLVETSGLADPAPVIQTLASDTLLAAHYRLDGVVTLVDAVNGPGQLDREAEAVKQAVLADRLLITKTDLAPGAPLRERLHALNPRADIAEVVQGEIDPGFLTGIGLASARADAAQVTRWLGAGSGEGVYLGTAAPRHDRSITTFTLRFDRPFAWQTFSAAMELLTSLRGPDLLRVKGLVNVEGEAGPVVVQGVQHVFHPPVTLAAWPSDYRGSRLVFITRGITEQAVAALFEAVGMLRSATDQPAR